MGPFRKSRVTLSWMGFLHWTLIVMGALPAWGEPSDFISLVDMPTVTQDALAPVEVGEVVVTDRGAVRGALDGNTYRFLGIPYAAAPVGNLRWRPPVDVAPWSVVRDARTPAAPCAHRNVRGVIVSTTEDCLKVNVWAPVGRSHVRPVVVWLHGGGNFQGNPLRYGPADWGGLSTSGRSFVEQHDVVFVSIAHRLGALGFLADPALDAGSSTGTSGNYGILDILAALQWIQRNIAAFAGDPRRVMLFSSSSGGDNVCTLLASPLAAGLFSAATRQDPFGRCETPTIADYEAGVGQTQVTRMGCAGAADVAACLRSLPVLAVLQNQIPGMLGLERPLYTPIIDGFVLTDSPVNMINNSQHNTVPFILGHNTDETFDRVTGITDQTSYENAIRLRFGSDLLDDVLALYPASNYASHKHAFVALTTDEIHTCPTRRIALAASKPGIFVDGVPADQGGHSRAFRYIFRQVAESDPAAAPRGSFHILEILYLFADWVRYTPSDAELALSNALRSYWTSFAHNGNPSYADGISWPLSNVENIPYLEIDTSIEARDNDTATRCDFWDSVSGFIQSRSQGYAAGEGHPFYSQDADE